MAMFLGAKGGDILATQSASHLLAAVREKLAGRMAYLLAGEDAALYRNLHERVAAELSFEEDFSRRFDQQIHDLEKVEYADQLADACMDFLLLVREHFGRRRSVIACHGMCTVFHDLTLEKALALATGGPDLKPYEDPLPCCLLATGSAGRKEFLQGTDSRYFLIYPDSHLEHASQYDELRYRLLALLASCGIVGSRKPHPGEAGMWLGTESDWRNWCLSQVQGGEKFAETMALLGDVRPVVGDEALIGRIGNVALGILAGEREKDVFAQVARKTASLPVALGMFGNFKVFRSGEHRGTFGLDEAAIRPLVGNVRVLAVHHGIGETGTVDRIKELLDAGHLSVDLADRLLKAVHLLFGFRIGATIDGQDLQSQEHYLDPDDLSEEDAYLFKNSLEAVINLQRIAYQVFTEQS